MFNFLFHFFNFLSSVHPSFSFFCALLSFPPTLISLFSPSHSCFLPPLHFHLPLFPPFSLLSFLLFFFSPPFLFPRLLLILFYFLSFSLSYSVLSSLLLLILLLFLLYFLLSFFSQLPLFSSLILFLLSLLFFILFCSSLFCLR